MKNNAKLTILQINDTHGYLDIHQEWFAVPQQPVYHLAGGSRATSDGVTRMSHPSRSLHYGSGKKTSR
jgi:2',3'-cyclic-nucleotide 2'-phosphodiesterase (5'-nucleotidase family)